MWNEFIQLLFFSLDAASPQLNATSHTWTRPTGPSPLAPPIHPTLTATPGRTTSLNFATAASHAKQASWVTSRTAGRRLPSSMRRSSCSSSSCTPSDAVCFATIGGTSTPWSATASRESLGWIFRTQKYVCVLLCSTATVSGTFNQECCWSDEPSM